MTSLSLDPGERRYWHWPVTGTAAVPQIKVGDGAYADMEAATGYVPDPVVDGATWYRALFAHPSAASNPDGTFVVSTPTKVWVRVAVSPQLIVEEAGFVIPLR